jgi:hypothetical protein
MIDGVAGAARVAGERAQELELMNRRGPENNARRSLMTEEIQNNESKSCTTRKNRQSRRSRSVRQRKIRKRRGDASIALEKSEIPSQSHGITKKKWKTPAIAGV